MRTVFNKQQKRWRAKLCFISKLQQVHYRIVRKYLVIPSIHRYCITVSNAYNFIWFRVPKVATMTIIGYLQENRIPMNVEYAYYVQYPPLVYKKYYKFAFIRNPWDRLVSCWINLVLEENHYGFTIAEREAMQDFEYFIDFVATKDVADCDGHLRLQCNLIDLNNIDFLGRLERFDEDFSAIRKETGMPANKVVVKNKSKRKRDYREYYNSKLKDRVYKMYEKDIRAFGYEF